jgi:hypothetical protein
MVRPGETEPYYFLDTLQARRMREDLRFFPDAVLRKFMVVVNCSAECGREAATRQEAFATGQAVCCWALWKRGSRMSLGLSVLRRRA